MRTGRPGATPGVRHDTLENVMLNVFRKMTRGDGEKINANEQTPPPASHHLDTRVRSLSVANSHNTNINADHDDKHDINDDLCRPNLSSDGNSLNKGLVFERKVRPRTRKQVMQAKLHKMADICGDKNTAFRSTLTHMLCGLYTLIIIVLGLVFPISSALSQAKVQDTLYVSVFHLYVYVVCLVFLVYMHVYLLRHRHINGHQDPVDTGSNLRNVSHISNNKLSANNKLTTPEYYLHEVSEMEILDHHDKDNVAPSPSPTEDHLCGDVISQTAPLVTFDAEGINFYLRLGAIGFGTSSMIHDGFRLAGVFEGGTFSLQCQNAMDILVAVSHMAFTFFQTFFLFKNHRIVVNVHKAFVRVGLMHMVATNLCVWSAFTVFETAEDLIDVEDMPSHDSHENITVHNETSSCDPMNLIASKASPYLFPCTIEYSLIAAAMLYKMYHNVGMVGKHTLCEDHEDNSVTDCHKANKGLFFGLFIMVLTLIAISCFFVFDQRFGYRQSGSLIFYITELALLFMSCAVVVTAFVRFQQLHFSPLSAEGSYDKALLVISFFGECIFNTFLFISSVTKVDEYGLVAILSLGTSLLTLLQAGLQTIFILDGLLRSADNQQHVRTKPGRALVTFLLICNFSLWIVNTFEVKKAENLPMHSRFYGKLAWSIISHMCIPMIIFFRFHSTVCLTDIWVNAFRYKRKEH